MENLIKAVFVSALLINTGRFPDLKLQLSNTGLQSPALCSVTTVATGLSTVGNQSLSLKETMLTAQTLPIPPTS